MPWATRASTSLMLALAVVALPLILNQCVVSCDAHQAPVTAKGSPACHHTKPLSPGIGHLPTSCGHDHNGTTPTVVSNSIAPNRGSDSLVAVTPATPFVDRGIGEGLSPGGFLRRPVIPPPEHSLSLRI